MKILLIGVNSKYIHTNLAIRYIKSYCSIFDIRIGEYTINDTLDDVISSIYSENPDIIGFSCYIWNIEMISKLCSTLKKILPSCKILLGGPEVTYDPVEFMENHSCIDYIIKGEGEVPSLQLFKFLDSRLGSIENIGSLVYRLGENIFENKDDKLIESLDSIPFPYDCKSDILPGRILYYESSRGCPYNCSYCLSSTIKGVRFFSFGRVIRDLKWFIDNNVGLVKFVDRTFNCRRDYVEIFKFLYQSRKDARFHFEISADIMDDEAVTFLKNIPEGLFQFEIGVQSVNRKVLGNINRRSDLEKLFHCVREIRESCNIHIHLDLIAGLPGEDYKSLAESFDTVYRLKPHMLQLGFLKMLKGSGIRNDAQRHGIVYNEFPPYEVLATKELSYREVNEIKMLADIVDRYHNSGRFATIMIYLSSIFKSPFMLFKFLLYYYNQNTYHGEKVSNIDTYRLLYNFCRSLKNLNMSTASECIAYDFLKQGRNSYIPDFIYVDSKAEREYMWDLLSDKCNIEKYLPNYTGLSAKQIIKNIYAREFSFDLCRYEEDGVTDCCHCIIVFDYGSKNKGKGVRSFVIRK